MTETFIVGFDGSVASRSAVRFAERLAGTTGAVVLAVAVHPAGARDRADALLAALRGDGIRRATVCGSSPVEGLRRIAVRRRATLLAVGAAHHEPGGRLAPGSVGARLLADAPCPVVVVPSAYENAEDRTVTIGGDDHSGVRALRAAEDLAVGMGARLVEVAA